MKSGKNKQTFGYTVIEVMIVLAVSGLMFVIASNFISGKQGHAAFTDGVNEVASDISKVIEETTDGQYSDIPTPCFFNGVQIVFNGAAPGQGQNNTCVFLGKLLHFNVAYSAGDPNAAKQYETASIAGGGGPGYTGPIITTLANAAPTVIPNLSTQATIPQQLSIYGMKVYDPTPPGWFNTYAMGFMQGLGSLDTTGRGGYASGAQTVSFVYDPNVTTQQTSLTGPRTLSFANQAHICLTDGTRNAMLVIGYGSSNQLGVTVQHLAAGSSPVCP